MEIPTKEIKSLCCYVECDVQLGIQAAPEWAGTVRRVLRWLEAVEQPRATDLSRCTCKSNYLGWKMGTEKDCPVHKPPSR